MRLTKVICSSFFLLLHINSNAQSSVLSNIEKKFRIYSSSFIKEKTFVHTDKPAYVAGETIWLKAYTVDACFHYPTTISKIVYAELLTEEKKAVLQAKLILINGNGNGSFSLPTTLKSGNYLLRAYTNWQKNDGSSSFFTKEILIVNTIQKSQPGIQVTATEPAIRFTPEGGELVSAIASKIAFKITGSDGKGADGNGVIVNERNDTVTTFQSHMYGIGSFSMIPKANEQYRAIVQLKNGDIVTSLLPKPSATGTVLQLLDNGNDVTVELTSTKETGSLSCFVHNRQIVLFNDEKALLNGKALFRIPKSIPGKGVLHITIFNEKMDPVCERLYFKHPRQENKITVTTNQPAYKTRDSVKLLVNATNQQIANDDIYNLSIAVYSSDSLTNTSSCGLESYLLLSSELNEQPEFADSYFSNSTPQLATAADDLMILHKWRQFSWNDVLKKEFVTPAYLPETEGHFVTAKLTHKVTGKPAPPETEAYLSMPGNKIILQKASTNKDGMLLFNMPYFFGATEFVIQTNDLKDTNFVAEIISPFIDETTNRAEKVLFKSFTPHQQELLLNYSVGMQTQKIYFTANGNSFYLPIETDTLSYYGRPNATYRLDDYTRFSSLEEVFREYIPQVKVTRRGSVLGLQAEDSLFENYFDEDPLAIIDGVPVFNINQLLQFDPLQIKSIEIITSQYYYGDLMSKGIISFKTYQGNLGGYQLHAGSFIASYEGLQLNREFTTPVYNTAEDKKSKLPDFRNVLFWQPVFLTNHSTTSNTVHFTTSDIPGNYVIMLEGINGKGEPFTKRLMIEVK
jgi:hypothetical protein